MTDYPNSGSLFEAETPKKSDTHPDREGSAEITCPHCNQKSDWWVNGWIKRSAKTGNRFLSLSFKLKQPKQDAKPKQEPFAHSEQPEEIPF